VQEKGFDVNISSIFIKLLKDFADYLDNYKININLRVDINTVVFTSSSLLVFCAGRSY